MGQQKCRGRLNLIRFMDHRKNDIDTHSFSINLAPNKENSMKNLFVVLLKVCSPALMGLYLLMDKLVPARLSQFKVWFLFVFVKSLGVKDDPELRGLIPNSFEHIFSHIAASKDAQYLVRASYLEIYKEEIRDLLQRDDSKRLEIKEKPDRGVYVKVVLICFLPTYNLIDVLQDLSTVLTKSITEIEKVMNIGYSNRTVGYDYRFRCIFF